MAVIRKEIKYLNRQYDEKNVFDCIVEAYDDLTSDDMRQVGIGSLAYSLDTNKLYCLTTDNTWVEIST